MEKVKNIALVILSIAVIWLFVDRYATQCCTSNNQNHSQSINANAAEAIAGGIKIAYVNIDTVLLSYDQAITMNNDFNEKRKKSEDEFAKKAKVFEKEYLAFQEKAQRGGFLSQASMEAQQNALLRQKEELEQLEAKLTQELMAEQQRLNEILYKAIVSYVERYNLAAGYDLILTNTGLGTIMQGNESLNITAAIIEGLNSEYKEKN